MKNKYHTFRQTTALNSILEAHGIGRFIIIQAESAARAWSKIQSMMETHGFNVLYCRWAAKVENPKEAALNDEYGYNEPTIHPIWKEEGTSWIHNLDGSITTI